MRTPIYLGIFSALCGCVTAFAQEASTQTVPAQTAVSLPAASPVFDCYAINFAWGFAMSGKFINSDGAIYSYRKTKQSWLAHDITENAIRYISDADLQAKYVEREKSGSVDAQTLTGKTALIDPASKGNVVQMDGGARDAGSSSCHAYVHDAAKARYRDVDLGSDGGVSDMRTKNDAPQAQDLLIWLKSIGVAK